MKKHLIVAASVAALAMVAASGAQAAVGHVDVAYTQVQPDNSALPDAKTYNLGGAVVLPSKWFDVQLDGLFTSTHVKGPGHDESFLGGIHAFKRNDQWAAGVVINEFDGGIWAYGVEGAVYQPSFTVSGQVVTAREEGNNNAGDLGIAAGIGGKYFINDNFTLGANYTSFNPKGAGSTADYIGANIEYKFDKQPVSVFAGYTRNNDTKDQLWGVGARFHFGAGSLKEQDRKGASMGSALGTLLSF